MIDFKLYYGQAQTAQYFWHDPTELADAVRPYADDWTECSLTIDGDVLYFEETAQAVLEVLKMLFSGQSRKAKKELFKMRFERKNDNFDSPMFGFTFSQDIQSTPYLRFVNESLENICTRSLQLRELAADDNPANIRFVRLAFVFYHAHQIDCFKLAGYALSQWANQKIDSKATVRQD